MPSERASDEVDALLGRVEERLDPKFKGSAGVDAHTAGLLARLAEVSPRGSEAWRLAHRELASLAMERTPWRASVLARRVVDADPGDHAAWGLLALAQSLLGNHGYAVKAYRRALRLAPDDASYAHNLGHLYDVAFDRPEDALPLLERARRRLPGNPHVTASHAHALARSGEPEAARAIMAPIVRKPASREHHELYAWLVAESDRAARRAMGEGRERAGRRRVRRRRQTGAGDRTTR